MPAAPMTVHQTRLTRRETVAERTMAFYFARPEGFRYRAGQSLVMTLVNPAETDSMGDTRTFTIASAPREPELMIATRLRDTAFKRVLQAAPPGLGVEIDGPDGELVLHDDAARPAVFLAGGIGITPFLSMARNARSERLGHRIHLFYANRRPEDAAFLAELQGMEQANPNFRLIATMEQPGASAQRWMGETGYIRREMLERHLAGVANAVYYFAGPPSMTMAMKRLLESMGVGAQDMRHEEFYGY
jgi:ferredoxin-NADP reductase